MISKSSTLTNFRKYKGIDTALIENGSSLQISGIGDSNIKQKKYHFATSKCFICS